MHGSAEGNYLYRQDVQVGRGRGTPCVCVCSGPGEEGASLLECKEVDGARSGSPSAAAPSTTMPLAHAPCVCAAGLPPRHAAGGHGLPGHQHSGQQEDGLAPQAGAVVWGGALGPGSPMAQQIGWQTAPPHAQEVSLSQSNWHSMGRCHTA